MPAPRHAIPSETLDRLDAIQQASAIPRSTFGRRFFNDAGFLDRVRRVGSCKRATHDRVAKVLGMAAAGELGPPPPRRRAMSTDLLPRVLAAAAAAGLGIQAFSSRYLGSPYRGSRLRKPHLLSATLTERIEAACNAVLGPPPD